MAAPFSSEQTGLVLASIEPRPRAGLSGWQWRRALQLAKQIQRERLARAAAALGLEVAEPGPRACPREPQPDPAEQMQRLLEQEFAALLGYSRRSAR